MSIFKEIQDSIYNVSYYEKVVTEKLSSSFVYFISLSLMVALFVSAVVSFRLLPIVRTGLDNFGPELVSRFPENLVVTIKAGQISTNTEEPAVIPLALGSSTPGLPQNFLVIDSKNPFDEARFREANTLLYATKDTIYVANEKGGIEDSESLKDMPDAVINRAQVVSWVGEATPFLSWVPFLIVGGLFFVSLWVSAMLALGLVIGALFIMAIGRLRGRKFSYKQSYQIGLHAMTLGILVNLVFVALPIFPALSFSQIILAPLTLLAIWMNFPVVVDSKKDETPLQ